MLLQVVLTGKRISRFYVGDITEFFCGRPRNVVVRHPAGGADGTGAEIPVAGAPRAARGWTGNYRLPEAQSEPVRHELGHFRKFTALTGNLMKPYGKGQQTLRPINFISNATEARSVSLVGDLITGIPPRIP